MQLAQIVTDQHGKELTERGTPLFPLSVYNNDMQAFASHSVPWHWHDECEFVYVTSGGLLLELPGTKQVVQEGDGAFINSSVLHAMRSHGAPSCQMVNIVFDPGIVGGSPSSVFQTRYVLPLTQQKDAPALLLRAETDWGRQAVRLLEEISGVYRSRNFGYELHLRSSLSELWLLLMQNAEISDGQRAGSDPYIKPLLTYIHEHYAESLTLGAIAASAGISCRTCSRTFREQLQMSVFGYLQDYRIRKAAEMLLLSDDPVTDICFSCGFNDPSYFTRTFRSHTGMTPRSFRQAARKT